MTTQPVVTSDEWQAASGRRTIRLALLVLLTFALPLLPLLALGDLLPWRPADGRVLVMYLSAPLLLFFGVLSLVCLRREILRGRALVFALIWISYILGFGVRALYLAWFPDVKLLPNFVSATDFVWLHEGLLWLTAGLVMMSLGYLIGPLRLSPRPRSREWLDKLFRDSSSLSLILSLYVVACVGRIYAMRTGSALWFYNSPAFDRIGTRANPLISGPMSMLTEFGPLAFAAAFAYWLEYRRSGRSPIRARILGLCIVLMTMIEIAYFSFGLYKFGLLGTVLILWLVPAVRGHASSMKALVLGGAFFLVVFPVINNARGTMTGFYLRSTRSTSEWARLMSVNVVDAYTAEDVYVPDSNSKLRDFSDPVAIRMVGAEAVAVASKYQPMYGYEGGKTYLNLVSLSLPRVLRPGTGQPTYIEWPTKYVGFTRTNPTVMPVPAAVEAFLSFGTLGVCVVMFLLGVLYRYVDSLSALAGRSAMSAGVFAYIVWRLLNIEHYLFIVLPAVAKTVVVLLVLLWLKQKLTGRRRVASYPLLGERAQTLGRALNG